MKTHIMILVALFGVLAGSLPAAEAIEAINEGFFVDGLDGVLKKTPGVDVWSFTCDSDIKMTEKRQIPAGTEIQILPCSVLEQMIKLAGDEQSMRVRLWALFTEYKHMNYLYAVYFLPLRTEQTPVDVESNTTQNDPGAGDSIIPQHILQQMQQNEAPDLEKFQQIAAVTGDVNLIGRTGYLEYKDRVYSFQLDAFGMNKDRQNIMLLPNQMLEEVYKRLAQTPGRQRFTVSGLLTEYKGRTYMLLRRAQRTYTQGNFTQ